MLCARVTVLVSNGNLMRCVFCLFLRVVAFAGGVAVITLLAILRSFVRLPVIFITVPTVSSDSEFRAPDSVKYL